PAAELMTTARELADAICAAAPLAVAAALEILRATEGAGAAAGVAIQRGGGPPPDQEVLGAPGAAQGARPRPPPRRPRRRGPAPLMTRARELADAICAAAPLAVAAALEILRATEGAGAAAGFAIQRGGGLPAYQEMLGSQDAAEGARAFAERREPRWQGR